MIRHCYMPWIVPLWVGPLLDVWALTWQLAEAILTMAVTLGRQVCPSGIAQQAWLDRLRELNMVFQLGGFIEKLPYPTQRAREQGQ